MGSGLMPLALACPNDSAREPGVLLTVTWPGQPPLRLRAAELAALPQQEIVQRRTLASAGSVAGSAAPAPVEQSIRYSGVLLRELLARSDVSRSAARGARALVFEALASDGYRAFFSWGELFNTPAAEQMLVITHQDGRPLSSDEGPLALRALADLRPGPRHVRNLCGLAARSALAPP